MTLLATRLPRDEFDIQVAALTRGGPYEEVLRAADIPVAHLNKRWKSDPFAYQRLCRLLKDFQPEILHTWLFAANAYGRLAVGKNSLIKTIVSERCVDSWKSGWQLQIDRKLAARTARLIANSNSVAEFYREQEFPTERITVIPNGVEMPKVTRRSAAGEDTRSKRNELFSQFNIPAGAKVVCFAGRLARQKRVKDLIWGMQLLRQLTDNVYFLIIGSGPERSRLEELTYQLDCSHVTRFAGHRDDATALVGLCDVFWLGSDFEGMSNSLMEAMAAGVPAVVSDIPPNRELCIDGETGFVVRVGDSVGFAQFTDRILADKEMADRLGDTARERMQSQFSIDSMVDAHVRLYRDVLDRGAVEDGG